MDRSCLDILDSRRLALIYGQVLRGSLREDVLWQMHDIFVSKSMLKHHSLDRYVGVLARVPVQ